jgi:hypothetical protein
MQVVIMDREEISGVEEEIGMMDNVLGNILPLTRVDKLEEDALQIFNLHSSFCNERHCCGSAGPHVCACSCPAY